MKGFNDFLRRLNNKRKLTFIIAAVILAAFLGYNYYNDTDVNPLKLHHFQCYEHEQGAAYKYTVSYRNKKFLVNTGEDAILNVYTGEALEASSKEFKQVKRCIKMFKLSKEGFIGESPAQLIDGKYNANPNAHNPLKKTQE